MTLNREVDEKSVDLSKAERRLESPDSVDASISSVVLAVPLLLDDWPPSMLLTRPRAD